MKRLTLFAVLFLPLLLIGADCDNTSIGVTPLNDLGGGFYLGQFQGGLYPDGQNDPPSAHHQAGLARAEQIAGRASASPQVNKTSLVFANGARGGQGAEKWRFPDHQNYDRIENTILAPAGLTGEQVQVIWMLHANGSPEVSLPDPDADAFALQQALGDIARAAKDRYPNLKMIFLSGRVYGGYNDTGLNPEPFAYESGLSVKWVIESQINQIDSGEIDPISGDLDYTNGVAPWLGWGAYPWADGLLPRSDGLVWECSDFRSDGAHPDVPGIMKFADLMLAWFLDSPYTHPWFVDPVAVSELLDLSAATGTILDGGLSELRQSDDEHLVVRSEPGFLVTEPNVADVLATSLTTIENPQRVIATLESHVNHPNAQVRVRFRNWVTGQFEQADAFDVPTADVVFNAVGESSDYIRADGTIDTSFRYVVPVVFSATGFLARLDLARIGVQ